MANDLNGTRGSTENEDAAGIIKTSGSGDADRSKEISMAEMGGIVSRTLGLPADSPEVMQFAGVLHGTINRDPVLRQAALNGGGIQSFIFSQAPPEIVAKLDPARRAEFERQRTLHTANRTGSEFAAAAGQSGSGAGGIAQGREARGNGGDGNRAAPEAAGRAGDASVFKGNLGAIGDPSAIPVQNRLDEQAVVTRRDADASGSARQQVGDTIPSIIAKGRAAHGQPPDRATRSESRRAPTGNTPIEDTP